MYQCRFRYTTAALLFRCLLAVLAVPVSAEITITGPQNPIKLGEELKVCGLTDTDHVAISICGPGLPELGIAPIESTIAENREERSLRSTKLWCDGSFIPGLWCHTSKIKSLEPGTYTIYAYDYGEHSPYEYSCHIPSCSFNVTFYK